jgi:hypothetical protein
MQGRPPVALAHDGYNERHGEYHQRWEGLVTPVRLLLSDDLMPIAEELCSLLGVPLSIVSAAPAWDGPVHRIVQIDLPRLHARVFEEAAARRGVSMESLVAAWIERCRAELAGDDDVSILRTCRRLAEWERLGYTGVEPGVSELVREVSRP